MNWKCWLAISALILALGVALGIMFWRDSQWRELDRLWQEKVAALEEVRDAAVAAAQNHRNEAESLRRENKRIRALLEPVRIRTKTRKKPETLAKCLVQTEELQEHISLLEASLSLADQESSALVAALVRQDEALAAQDEIIVTQKKRIDGMKKHMKRQKLKVALISVGVGVAAGLGGYGIGVAVK